MVFEDRIDAARKLARALAKFRGKNPLVLAIPRGAVPMGRLIADELEGELDVVLVRKLGAPGNPEFAVGAVDESGWTYIADWATEVGAVLAEATLSPPAWGKFRSTGKHGVHTEHMGYLLAEMQALPRSFPGARW